MSVSSPPPQGLTCTEMIHQGDPSKTTHRILSPLDSTLHGLTHKPSVITHSPPLYKLFLCPECPLHLSVRRPPKMQFNHQLPTKPSVKSSHLLLCFKHLGGGYPYHTPLSPQHSNCLSTGLPPLDSELLRPGGQFCPLSPHSAQPRSWSTVGVQ